MNSVNEWRATGNGAMAETFAPGCKFELGSVRVHLSAAGGAGNFTATVDAESGSAYDFNFITEDMTASVDVQRAYNLGEMSFSVGDEIDFAWANAGAKTWGLEVKWREAR